MLGFFKKWLAPRHLGGLIAAIQLSLFQLLLGASPMSLRTAESRMNPASQSGNVLSDTYNPTTVMTSCMLFMQHHTRVSCFRTPFRTRGMAGCCAATDVCPRTVGCGLGCLFGCCCFGAWSRMHSSPTQPIRNPNAMRAKCANLVFDVCLMGMVVNSSVCMGNGRAGIPPCLGQFLLLRCCNVKSRVYMVVCVFRDVGAFSTSSQGCRSISIEWQSFPSAAMLCHIVCHTGGHWRFTNYLCYDF